MIDKFDFGIQVDRLAKPISSTKSSASSPTWTSSNSDVLNRFVRTHAFVSQIADAQLERDYVFCRALSLYVRDTGGVERLDLGTKVELTHLRHQVTSSGDL